MILCICHHGWSRCCWWVIGGFLILPWHCGGWRIPRDDQRQLLYGAPRTRKEGGAGWRFGEAFHPWSDMSSREGTFLSRTAASWGIVTGVNDILMRPSVFCSLEVRVTSFVIPLWTIYRWMIFGILAILRNNSIERWVGPFQGRTGNHDRNVGEHLGQSRTVIDGKI